MGGPQRSAQEAIRLRSLRDYGILDTGPEPDFDAIAQLAAEICEAPIALITLVDEQRQWFKARVGYDLEETDLSSSFCVRALGGPDVLEIQDARADPRFKDNPLVTEEPHVRFYAGAPLRVGDGYALGTVCVLDHRPRTLSPAQRRALRALARHATAEVELRRYAREAADNAGRAQELDVLKERILSTVGHELRTPLSSIRGYLEILLDDADPVDPALARQFLGVMQRNSERLLHLVDDMLTAAEFGSGAFSLRLAEVDLAALVTAVVEENRPLTDHQRVQLVLEAPERVPVPAARRPLEQALRHLLLNAIRYTVEGEIRVRVEKSPVPAVVVRDTGTGIAAEDLPRLFDPFYRAPAAEVDAVQGAGLGLTVVRAIVEAHGGTITIDSTPAVGTTVRLTVGAAPEPR
ncbi:GAF domain-containing sensor histidine kinase [Cryptosporangium aurantiacum]|uniref:histidine kinase n=1 Tax=Cryptosporangium aurantiacum TaxID=134849 RepID=A0A1M7R763_9ACTN|nr:GAF domain-containing sensor histidine kinase [Cryptosporangium aurantiacum]SHN41991.1 GAF sensor signal transduction histidine kinase [Cryptosporangium aurantiacum]